MVGTSGSVATRLLLVTASAFSRPAFTCSAIAPRFWNDTLAWPAIRSLMAGPPPRYGTWMPVVPVFCQNSAAVR